MAGYHGRLSARPPPIRTHIGLRKRESLLAHGMSLFCKPDHPTSSAFWPSHGHQRFALDLVTKWNLPKEIRSGLVRHFAYANDNAPVSVASVTILAESLTQRIDLDFESASEIASIAQSHLRLGDSMIQRIVEGLSGLTREC